MASFTLKDLLDVNEIKNKPVKFAATLLVMLFITALIGVLISQSIRYFSGSYTNIFGWEPNGPEYKEQRDTIFINKPSKIDTVYTEKEMPRIGDNSRESVINKKSKKQNEKNQESKKTDTIPTIVAGKNVNTGTNNGIIGDNATVNQRPVYHPDNNILNQIEATIVDKSEALHIMALSPGISYDYANELRGLLEKRGYKKISLGSAQMAPMPPKGVSYDNRRGEHRFYINFD